jgi:hypothetical protein
MKKYPRYNIPKYYLKENGSFVIENYNLAKPFANFFSAIAGQYGIPMWVFYVNRGQCIASFGIKDKDNAFLEFFPANRAWQFTPNFGFRTFIKVTFGKRLIFYEPFYNGNSKEDFQLYNSMIISSYDLTLREENRNLGLDIEINYFPVPNDYFAALARVVKIKNTSPRRLRMQLLDGLPLIIPLGVSNRFLKKLGRTSEAWMRAKAIGNWAALYKLDVDPIDRPEVIYIQKGNFYISFAKPILDASTIFGPRLNFDYPYLFLKQKKFRYPTTQVKESKTPSGMGLINFELKPDEEKYLRSLFGSIRNIELLNSCLNRIKNSKYFENKKIENHQIIERIQNDIDTQSVFLSFNSYCRQTYLDNIIRGGYPIVFKTDKNNKQVFYLYMRKHGDLERDYNRFLIQPRYFSQGNGNFRDIVQNRRNDVWFNPDIDEANLITFFNLIQTDGFNPLIVKGLHFHLKDKEDFRKICMSLVNSKDINNLLAFLDKPYTPGSVIFFLEENRLSIKVSRKEFLNTLMVNSIKEDDAQHKQADDHGAGGFWTDHWIYCLDLLQAYLELYPEKHKELIFEKKEFKFFDNVFVVRTRREKYVVYDGKVRQLDSVKFNEAKAQTQKQRPIQARWARIDKGQGQIYKTTLIAKLICILVNKIACLDPFGCGVEMEANKPNWYDALNGLPALFGSSICETMQLLRLINFLKQILAKTHQDSIFLFEELYDFLISLADALNTYNNENSKDRDFMFWNKSHFLSEEYREKTLLGIDGGEKKLDKETLMDFLNKALNKLSAGIKQAYNKSDNLYCAYFINEVTEYELKDNVIIPRRFKQKKLPLFLEAQVHALRIQKNKLDAARIHQAVKSSPLYDKKLKMYKVTADLSNMPFEIGRCRAFSRGWLENESVWLHMEYKYLLELLKSGLYKEFYAEFKNVLVCFQEPKRYGRSILENSSFIVSSVFPDRSLHGAGFVARLSGSTAEFLHIWRIINVGQNPFFLNERNELNLRLAPILPGWMFKKDKTYSFNFLGSIKVIYHNSKRKDTFGKNAASIKKILIKNRDGQTKEISSNTIPSPLAEQIRSRLITQIEIFLD